MNKISLIISLIITFPFICRRLQHVVKIAMRIDHWKPEKKNFFDLIRPTYSTVSFAVEIWPIRNDGHDQFSNWNSMNDINWSSTLAGLKHYESEKVSYTVSHSIKTEIENFELKAVNAQSDGTVQRILSSKDTSTVATYDSKTKKVRLTAPDEKDLQSASQFKNDGIAKHIETSQQTTGTSEDSVYFTFCDDSVLIPVFYWLPESEFKSFSKNDHKLAGQGLYTIVFQNPPNETKLDYSLTKNQVGDNTRFSLVDRFEVELFNKERYALSRPKPSHLVSIPLPAKVDFFDQQSTGVRLSYIPNSDFDDFNGEYDQAPDDAELQAQMMANNEPFDRNEHKIVQLGSRNLQLIDRGDRASLQIYYRRTNNKPLRVYALKNRLQVNDSSNDDSSNKSQQLQPSKLFLKIVYMNNIISNYKYFLTEWHASTDRSGLTLRRGPERAYLVQVQLVKVDSRKDDLTQIIDKTALPDGFNAHLENFQRLKAEHSKMNNVLEYFRGQMFYRDIKSHFIEIARRLVEKMTKTMDKLRIVDRVVSAKYGANALRDEKDPEICSLIIKDLKNLAENSSLANDHLLIRELNTALFKMSPFDGISMTRSEEESGNQFLTKQFWREYQSVIQEEFLAELFPESEQQMTNDDVLIGLFPKLGGIKERISANINDMEINELVRKCSYYDFGIQARFIWNSYQYKTLRNFYSKIEAEFTSLTEENRDDEQKSKQKTMSLLRMYLRLQNVRQAVKRVERKKFIRLVKETLEATCRLFKLQCPKTSAFLTEEENRNQDQKLDHEYDYYLYYVESFARGENFEKQFYVVAMTKLLKRWILELENSETKSIKEISKTLETVIRMYKTIAKQISASANKTQFSHLVIFDADQSLWGKPHDNNSDIRQFQPGQPLFLTLQHFSMKNGQQCAQQTYWTNKPISSPIELKIIPDENPISRNGDYLNVEGSDYIDIWFFENAGHALVELRGSSESQNEYCRLAGFEIGSRLVV
jgi:hypothetical protein